MKICIVGAGATGGYLGSKLIQAGVDVSLIARNQHLKAMKENGLTIIENLKKFTCYPKCSDSSEKLGKMDYIFITLKAYSISGMVEQIAQMFNENTSIITSYNGIPWWYFYNIKGKFENYKIKCIDPLNVQWNIFKPERVIGCVVYPATEIIKPGIIKHIEGNRFSIGEPDGLQSDRVSKLSKILSEAKLKAPIRKDIRKEIWTKLIGNLAFNPLSVIKGETLDNLVSRQENRDIAYSIMNEASLIMEKLGIHLDISINQRIAGALKVGAHKTSMLQDYEKNRELELDAIVGTVKEIGDLVNIKTPTIDKILLEVKKKCHI